MNTLLKNCLFMVALSILASLGSLRGEVLIMTHIFNKPNMVYWHHETLKKFLKDEYKFVVFNDAPNDELSKKTKEICQILGIDCVDVPQSIHYYKAPYLSGPRTPLGDPSAECADTIQYMLDILGFDYPGISVVIDSDMFLIRELSIEKMMNNYAISAHPQHRESPEGRITYMLPNLLIFNMEKLPEKKTLNFNVGKIHGVNVDTGGFTHFYLEQHPDISWLKTDCVTIPLDVDKSRLDRKVIDYFKSKPKMFSLLTEMKYDYEVYYEYTFLHFRAGSNWYKMNPEKFKEKSKIFYEALGEILN